MKNIIIGIVVGLVIAIPFLSSKKVVPKTDIKSIDSSNFPYLAKRIFLDNANDTIVNFTQLRSDLKRYVAEKPEKIGVYFEYLPTGVNIGVNEKEEFYRASLIKLPLVMRAYKMIGNGIIKKDENLRVRRDLLNEDFGDLWKTGAGTDIPLTQVIDLILTKSDNTAYNMLLDRVNQAINESDSDSEVSLEEVYDYLDIPKSDEGNNFLVTPKAYSSILKSLFFSSYLNYQSSNEILDILSKSIFTDSIPKFIPKEIKIAHKNGFNNLEDPKKQVVSDCGIVYVPNRQYILCIMVNSSDEIKSLKYISEISGITYRFVNSANK